MYVLYISIPKTLPLGNSHLSILPTFDKCMLWFIPFVKTHDFCMKIYSAKQKSFVNHILRSLAASVKLQCELYQMYTKSY